MSVLEAAVADAAWCRQVDSMLSLSLCLGFFLLCLSRPVSFLSAALRFCVLLSYICALNIALADLAALHVCSARLLLVA